MRILLVILLSVALPASAADFDLRWYEGLSAFENEVNAALALWVEGDFQGEVAVHYEIRLPRGVPSTGTIVFKPNDRKGHMRFHPPNDDLWGGILYGDVTFSYTHPVSGAAITETTIPMRAEGAGDATVTVHVDEDLGIAPASATVHVYGGDVTLAADSIRLGIGESVDVAVRLENPSPAGTALPADAANARIAGTAAFVQIGADGTGRLTITGVAAGKTRVHVYSPGGRVVTWLDVEVVKSEVAVTSVTPPVGPPVGGTTVTINGRGFIAPCTVAFSGSFATGIAVLNETTIRATTSAHAAGTVPVVVTCSGEPGTLANAFTYAAGRGRAVRH